MLVSVLMTAFNREKYIAASIESVLNSSFSDFELIIVDDYSSDFTYEIAKLYQHKDKRIKVYSNDVNLGDYPNRNRAAQLAKGKYIKFLDSDDLIYKHGLQVMVESMECFPDAGFGLSSVGDSEIPCPVLIKPAIIYKEHFAGIGHFDRAPGSSIIKREVFFNVGGFSGKRMIGDFEFWFKIARDYPMVKIQRDLYWDRKHIGQESNSIHAISYPSLRLEVLKRELNNESCPLARSEIRRIIRTSVLRHWLSRNLFLRIKKWFNREI
jgi:glycosyltransferase involved in cell wall biosynthesis